MIHLSKCTYQAASDVALIKYWGKKDEILRLPENGSISLILAGLTATTTVAFSQELTHDQVTIQGESRAIETQRVSRHLDTIRKLAGVRYLARVESVNSFPKGTGLSSSGSGFAALTYAALGALGLDLPEREISILARSASGTACRCVCGGFVEWKDGDTSESSYSETIFPADHWPLCDVVAVVDKGMKKVSSTEGHKAARSSPFYAARQVHIQTKLEQMKALIAARNFTQFGLLVEAEALEFHSILLTSTPPHIAWYPGTIQVMQEVQQMRREGIEAYFTINTGFNVHVLTLPDLVAQVKARLAGLPLVIDLLEAKVGGKPVALSEHLF